jgi:hypothetical protein
MQVRTGKNKSPKLIIFPFQGVVAANKDIMGIKKLIRMVNPER